MSTVIRYQYMYKPQKGVITTNNLNVDLLIYRSTNVYDDRFPKDDQAQVQRHELPGVRIMAATLLLPTSPEHLLPSACDMSGKETSEPLSRVSSEDNFPSNFLAAETPNIEDEKFYILHFATVVDLTEPGNYIYLHRVGNHLALNPFENTTVLGTGKQVNYVTIPRKQRVGATDRCANEQPPPPLARDKMKLMSETRQHIKSLNLELYSALQRNVLVNILKHLESRLLEHRKTLRCNMPKEN